MQQKVTQLEKANRSHVDNKELQIQVSLISLMLFSRKLLRKNFPLMYLCCT